MWSHCTWSTSSRSVPSNPNSPDPAAVAGKSEAAFLVVAERASRLAGGYKDASSSYKELSQLINCIDLVALPLVIKGEHEHAPMAQWKTKAVLFTALLATSVLVSSTQVG